MDAKELDAIDILNNLMTNISTAYRNRDWELIRMSFNTAVWDRKDAGLPPFVGRPSIREMVK